MANNNAEEQNVTTETAASDADAVIARAPTPRKSKKPVATKKSDQKAERPRPAAAPARPSIYESITSAAKKLEAERAAKSAAIKASTATQNAASKPSGSSGAEKTKRAASPFLSAPITTRAKPVPSASAKTASGAVSEAAQRPATPPVTPSPAAELNIEPPVAIATPLIGEQTASPKTPVNVRPEAGEQSEAHRLAATKPAKSPLPSNVSAYPSTTRTQARSAPTARTTPSSAPRPHGGQPPRSNRGQPSSGSHAQQRSSQPSGAQAQPRSSQALSGHAQSRAAPTSGAQVQPRPSQSANVQTQPRPGQPSRTPYNTPSRQQTKPVARAVTHVIPRPIAPPAPVVPVGPVAVPSVITVRELAPLLSVSVSDVLKKLITMGILASINQSLDYETASALAEKFDRKAKPMEAAAPKVEAKPSLVKASTDSTKGQLRPPIVTVLGHVDHGKTSLLDAIRNAKVAAGEAGGITQHIGAYQIEKQGRQLTFLDTPGHEAFTAMRARGAQLTDVAVLVVAADDGVMPQTIEAINHARAANVPIVVALNKIDRETADPARVTRQLADQNVVVEEWGGDVPIVKVSARKLIGIDELLDMILLVADLAEHKADPNLPAVGTVVEAEMDRSRGPVATLLVQNGTLRQNDYLVIGGLQCRIRAMFDDHGQRLSEAGPSTPVLVLGLPSVPEAGMTFQVVADERTARSLAEQTVSAAQSQTARGAKALSLDDLYAQMQAGKVQELNVILKADVQGSLEPIHNSLDKLSSDALRVRILHQGLGHISESDVSLALASGAIVIGFNAEVDPAARRLANMEGVDIRQYNIIYKLIEDVEKALKGLLEPTYREVIAGRAQVRQVFKVNKKTVAGCYVSEGKATRSGQARVMRAGKSVFDGRIASLKRFTEDAREVLTNFECGVMLDGFEDVRPGDVIEFYAKEKVE